MAGSQPPATEKTVSKHSGLKPYKPGQSGNPAGRPKGARSKLGEAFIKALADDFERHGIAALMAMRDDKPGDYIKVVASILPKAVIGSEDEDDAAIRVSLVKRIIIDA